MKGKPYETTLDGKIVKAPKPENSPKATVVKGSDLRDGKKK